MGPEPTGAGVRIVLGLGNPGPRYRATRHNLGFRVVDRVADRCGVSHWREAPGSLVAPARVAGQAVLLAKPQTYMNRSGEALSGLLAAAGAAPDQILVVHDDLDLEFGRLKIRTGGGHGGHNGVRSLMAALGTGAFPRLKLGIGRPPPGGDVVEYVLAPFEEVAQGALQEFLERAAEAAWCIVGEGPERAMHRFHTDTSGKGG